MSENNPTIQDFVEKNVALDLVKGVTVEVYPSEDPKQFIVALYDRTNPHKAAQGSWLCNEADAIKKLQEINKRYGKEVPA